MSGGSHFAKCGNYVEIISVAALFSQIVPCGTAAAQSATSYSYDALGRLVGVRDGIGVKTDYVFDEASNRKNVNVIEQFPQAWPATSLDHLTGRAESGGWAAYVTDPAGHIVYGPYVNLSARSYVAAFRLLVDNNNADNANVVIIDVWDSTIGGYLASRTLTRNEWKTAGSYEIFELPFTVSSGSVSHYMEFRVKYLRTAYVRVDKVGYR